MERENPPYIESTVDLYDYVKLLGQKRDPVEQTVYISTLEL